MEKQKRWRVAALIERPIPFYTPHYRLLADDPDVEVNVVYLSDAGLKPFTHYGVNIQYGSEILDGYPSVILGQGHPDGLKRKMTDHFLPELWRVLRDGQYDAVWIHGYNLPGHWLAFVSCILQDIPILLRGESVLVSERSLPRRIIKRVLLRWLFTRVAGFLCIGSLNRDFYRDYGVAESKLFWMPYGIDNAWYGGVSEVERRTWRKEVRERLGIAEDTIFFINHSKHVLPKRPADVIRAFARLNPKANAVLFLTGEGEQRSEVDTACKTLQAGQRVVLLGLQPYDELRKLLVAADVLAFASEEPWGMAVSEALAAGLAILCSDKVAGAVDMVEEGVNGYRFRSRDEDDLARRMRELTENPGLIRAMGNASREKAKAFSFEAMNEGLRAALTAIASWK